MLNITSIDPIENKFIFERFLNPERVEMPDVDSDISKKERARGIEYLLTKYGKQYVAQIITFIKYKIRGIIKAAGASLGIDPQEVNAVTMLIPASIEGIEVSYETLVDIRDNPDNYEDMSAKIKNQAVRAINAVDELFQRYPDLYLAAQKLNGVVSSTGLHAGGVVISGLPLAGNLPMTKGSDTAVLPVLQVNMNDVPFYNLLKIDVLGLRTLDQIFDTMKMTGLDWDWYDNEDWADDKVYEFLRQGHTTDVFQFSSPAGTRMLRDFKVSTLGDLTAVNAGNRPGPLAKDKDTGISPVDQYKASVDSGQIKSLDPRIDSILADTQGSLWYQEQTQKLGQVMAGYTLGSADLKIRKPLAKKQMEKIPSLETEFIYGKEPLTNDQGHILFFMPDGTQREIDLHAKVEDVRKKVNDAYNQGGHPKPSLKPSKNCIGAVPNGFDEELSINIFNTMKAFAKYSFNRSHSGSYAAIAYKCAYMSYHYPIEWAVGCAGNYDKKEKVQSTIAALKKRGCRVLPPSINNSFETFTVEKTADGEAMRYGLVDIPSVGQRAVSLIKLVRDKGLFLGFDDFYNRCTDTSEPDIRQFIGLSIRGNLNANPINKASIINLIKSGAFDEFDDNRHRLINHYMVNIRKESVLINTTEDPKTKKKIKTELQLPLDEVNFFRKDRLAMEKEVMGGYISEHPLEPFPYVDFSNCPDTFVSFAAIILNKYTKKTKGGKSYTEISVEVKDSSTLVVRLFGKTNTDYGKLCKEGKLVIIQGRYDSEWNNVTLERLSEIVPSSSPNVDDATAFQDVFPNTIPMREDLASGQDFSSLNTPSVVDFFSAL